MTAKLAVWKNVTAHSSSGLVERESTVKGRADISNGYDLLQRALMHIDIIYSLNTKKQTGSIADTCAERRESSTLCGDGQLCTYDLVFFNEKCSVPKSLQSIF